MTERDDDLHDPRLSALYRRKDGEQPPARVDAVIRKAAHAAVKRPVTRRLWPSLATTALLVLGVTVALKVFEQPELNRPQPELQSLDRVPMEASGVEQAREDASRKNGFRVDEDRMESTGPIRSKAVPRRDSAEAMQPTPAGSQYVPSAKRTMEGESPPVAAAPAATPSSSFMGRAAAPRVESSRSVEGGVATRDGEVAETRTDIDDSVLSEAPSALDCSVYGNLLELTEEERQRRLDDFRRRQDEAAIRCFEQAREGVDR